MSRGRIQDFLTAHLKEKEGGRACFCTTFGHALEICLKIRACHTLVGPNNIAMLLKPLKS